MMDAWVDFTAENDPDWQSKGVNAVLKDDYTHVLIRFRDEAGVEKVFHSITEGVCVQVAEEFYKTHYSVKSLYVKLNCTQAEFRTLTEKWNDIDYGYTQFLNCFLDELPLLGRINVSTNGLDEMICSELVARVLQLFTEIYKFTESFDSICPNDVENAIRGKGKDIDC